MIPDDIGTETTISGLVLTPDTEYNTRLQTALIEQLLTNRRVNAPTAQSYTLVLDGLAGSDLDHLTLDHLFATARSLDLHIVITTQSPLVFAPAVAQQLRGAVRTYITGQVPSGTGTQVAATYPTLTAEDLRALLTLADQRDHTPLRPQ